ncbi:hypothetical protein TNCT_40581 [Trichonephila clavata]|uniref:Uncharacterized protein n=1 Tax=Trichonephila clavata TaxID=2740835 RepID=A0A8X6LW84_TRICU|nr:hypothetical protein TNCT_40581 [Trichonephila clavata]
MFILDKHCCQAVLRKIPHGWLIMSSSVSCPALRQSFVSQQCLFANDSHIYILLEENKKLQLSMVKKRNSVVACQRMQSHLQVFIERVHIFFSERGIMFGIYRY